MLAAFPRNQRLAMKACKGPGKTAVLAWLAWNFLVASRGPQDRRDLVSGDNLADNLWAEMAKWQAKSPLLSAELRMDQDAHLQPAPARDLVDERPHLGEVGRPGAARPDAGRPARRLHPVPPRRDRAASPTR